MLMQQSVSLTYFMDFVSRSGAPKLTIVQGYKNREEHDPQADFYELLREKLVEVLRGAVTIPELQAWAGNVHPTKQPAYLDAIAGFKRFVGRKQIGWFEPPGESFALGTPASPLMVNINPELGLVLQGVPYVVKLYLKEERLPKSRARLILYMLEQALSDPENPRAFGVLDIRAGRLHTVGVERTDLEPLLDGEAASFATMYSAL